MDNITIDKELDIVHIVFSCDIKQFIGLLATVKSIIKNTSYVNRLYFHFVIDFDKDILVKNIKEYFPDIHYDINIYEPNKFLKKNIYVRNRVRLRSVMNFARFYFHDILPDVGKIIYLDVDIIVQGDIIELWNNTKLEKYYFAAKENNKTFHRDFNFYNYIIRSKFKPYVKVFNAGVYVTDLIRWREHKTTKQIEGWITKQLQYRGKLYNLGTQPPLNLVFYKKYEKIPFEWNFLNLGWIPNINENDIKKAKILHWNGEKKPWLENGLYKKIWNTYKLKIIT